MQYTSLAIAILVLSSIGAMLGVYDGRPLSDWSYGINMNTILSLLATAWNGSMLLPVRACLSQLKCSWYHRSPRKLDDFEMFDAASHGPLGAAALLYRLKFWHLASTRSRVILLTHASDAFTQQSLRFPVVVVDSLATVPISRKDSKVINGSDPIDSEVQQTFLPALYNGILAKDLSRSSSAVSASCSTGNCTFPPYASLAMCSACAEVTSLLNSTELRPDNELRPQPDWLHSLPKGLEMSYSYHFPTGMNVSVYVDPNTGELQMYQPRLLNLTAILADYGTEPRFLQAFDCVFYFCVRVFLRSVVQNEFKESIIDVYHQTTDMCCQTTDMCCQTTDMCCQTTDMCCQTTDMCCQTNLKVLADDYSGTDYNMTIPQSQLPSGMDLNIVVRRVDWLERYMTQALTGSVSITYADVSGWENDIVHSLFSQGRSNFHTTMDNLATAITNVMRTISGDTAVGKASKNITYIQG